MSTTYTHILDLAREAEPPADGILSRTVFQDVLTRLSDADRQIRHRPDNRLHPGKLAPQFGDRRTRQD